MTASNLTKMRIEQNQTMTAKARLDFAPVEALGIQIETNKPLGSLTSIKVGGPADYFAAITDTHQLIKLVRWARSVELPYLLLGGGSNVLISDRGVRGLVIHNRCRSVRLDDPPCCDYPNDDRPTLFAESGAAMAGVARFSVREGLTGLEWAVSVPGTVGGAVVNNAGAHGGEIKDVLENALVLTSDDEVKEFGVAEFEYAYRRSKLKRENTLQAGFGPVVLSANFRLSIGDPDAIQSRARTFLEHRRSTQPVEPSLGSTFKNPDGDFAGRLIQEAGLQGKRIGGIEVSTTHANFLINPGGLGSATAADVIAMIDYVQEQVFQRFQVELTPEIQLVGEW